VDGIRRLRREAKLKTTYRVTDFGKDLHDIASKQWPACLVKQSITYCADQGSGGPKKLVYSPTFNLKQAAVRPMCAVEHNDSTTKISALSG